MTATAQEAPPLVADGERRVSIATLRDSFRLDESGRLFWNVSNTHRVKIGSEAGTTNGDGYRVLMVQGQRILSHRVVFAMTHGHWPADEIDHVNGIRSDNRPENLREASKSQNMINRPIRPDNKSGAKGVGWCNKSLRWRARIRANGKRVALGMFDTVAEAAEAYNRAAAELHGEFARGSA